MEEITCIRAAVLFEAAFRFGVEIGFALAMAANSDTASVASLDTSCCDLDDGSATDQEDNGSITTPMVYKFRKGMVLRCLILLRGQCLCGYVIMWCMSSVEGAGAGDRAVHSKAQPYEGEVLQVLQAQFLGRCFICNKCILESSFWN